MIERCNWPVAYEDWRDILCGQPAVIRIDRPWHLPSWLICAQHMNDLRVYREAQVNGASWLLVREPEQRMISH